MFGVRSAWRGEDVRMRRCLVVLLGMLALGPVATAEADVRAPGLSSPFGTEQLSDERTITRWAHALFQGAIRRDTWVSSPALG